ncbi:hypothetical protein CQA53_11890, partial [Helicobacter didelphidarum]
NLKDNKPNSEKHREFLKSLNTIGLNNIRAMYEGIMKDKEQQRESRSRSNSNEKFEIQSVSTKNTQEKPPKLIGRLATTIVMKNGLYIG